MSTDVSRKRKGKDYLEDIGIDKRILLEGSVKKQCVSCVCVCVCVCVKLWTALEENGNLLAPEMEEFINLNL